MKLYTEEQVKNILEKMSLETERKNLAVSINWKHRAFVIDMLLNSLTPIELPIEEEVYKQAYLHSYLNELPDENAVSYIEGANFVINQIKK